MRTIAECIFIGTGQKVEYKFLIEEIFIKKKCVVLSSDLERQRSE